MINKPIINPRKEKGDPDLPATGLLCVNPGDARYICAKAEKLGAVRHFLFNSNLYITQSDPEKLSIFIAGPAVGAPMAVMTMEKLIALGARKVIVYGWCGSLNPELQTGDILLPTWGASEEGTSKHYPILEKPASNESWRHDLGHVISTAGFGFQEGPILSIDAPYRETRKLIHDYAGKSILGLDMEFSALATLAIYRQIDLAAFFLVSDELWRKKWHPGFKSKTFLATNRQIMDLLVQILSGKGGSEHDR